MKITKSEAYTVTILTQKARKSLRWKIGTVMEKQVFLKCSLRVSKVFLEIGAQTDSRNLQLSTEAITR